MVIKTKSFPKLTPTRLHKPVCLSDNTDKILLFTLYGKLRVSSKKEFVSSLDHDDALNAIPALQT